MWDITKRCENYYDCKRAHWSFISLYRDNQLSFYKNRYISFDKFIDEIVNPELSNRFLYSSVYMLLIEKFSEDNIYFYQLKK